MEIREPLLRKKHNNFFTFSNEDRFKYRGYEHYYYIGWLYDKQFNKERNIPTTIVYIDPRKEYIDEIIKNEETEKLLDNKIEKIIDKMDSDNKKICPCNFL